MTAVARAAAHAALLLWDAPFIPVPAGVAGGGEGVWAEPRGVPLRDAEAWPRGARIAAAVQLVAATVFLFERGWYPSRRLLRGCRVDRTAAGVRLTLPRLPGRRLDGTSARRVGNLTAAAGRDVRVALLAPLLDRLVPERRDAVRAAVARRPDWDAPVAMLEGLLSGSRGTAFLAHPDGPGRALWARRLDLPRDGIVWVEEPSLLRRLESAALLMDGNERGTGSVVAGDLEEADLILHQSASARDDRSAIALTTLASPLATPIGLARGPEAVWVLAADAERAAGWMSLASERGRDRAALAAEILAAGARDGFLGSPACPPGSAAAEAIVSPAARRLIKLLRSAPAGLVDDELAALAGEDAGAIGELERVRMVRRQGGAWRAADAIRPDAATLHAMARALPLASPRRMLAVALVEQNPLPLAAWCEAQLEAERAVEMLAVASPAASAPEIALCCAEAALATGRPGEALDLLERVPEGARSSRWHALAAWRAEMAFEPETAGEALALVRPEELPARLAARAWLSRAEQQRRGGDRRGESASLARAVGAASPPLALALVHEAAARGVRPLRELVSRHGGRWPADTLVRALHLMGYQSFEAGAWAAAATAYRAALRAASGENIDLLARLHSDLAAAYILLERAASAERHLLLAERLFTRCGTVRAAKLTRAARAVVACDRLDVRLAEELRAGLGVSGLTAPTSGAWLDEMESVRIALARGDVASAQRRLPAIEAGVAPFLDRTTFRQDVAELRAHVALGLGDLRAAADAVEGTAGTDRDLVMAIVRANGGEAPPSRLPQRWGLAITARLLALWRRDRPDEARTLLAQALERTPAEAAVGFARLAAALVGGGERLGREWGSLRRSAGEVLRRNGLDGWRVPLDAAMTLDSSTVVRAIDSIVNAGSDGLRAERLAGLGEALGLLGIEVCRGARCLARWGTVEGHAIEEGAGDLTIRADGPASETTAAVLGLVARFVAGRHGGPDHDTVAEGELIGSSPALDELRRLIEQWAPLPATVLIEGEPGTGKELVARALHRRSGRRGEFVAVNCAGIPAALLETELFGAVRGAYTGADRDRAGLVEAAEGGTLFLDEVGELPPELQAKLLRLLQEREVRRLGATRSRRVDVRFVAATNRDLAAAMSAGGFRQDLYFRLAVAVITVPPLRERPADVEALARHFVARYAAEFQRPGVTLSAAALLGLGAHSWPGNVRELDLMVQRAVAGARAGDSLGPDRFPGLDRFASDARALPTWAAAHEELRRSYFARLLAESGGNRSEAARRAGLSRQALLYHLRTLGLPGRDKV